MSDLPTISFAQELAVELWYAPLPRPLARIAWHCYFVVRCPNGATRYEVWRRKNAGGENVGHVYRNLMPPEGNCGGGPSACFQQFGGADAERIVAVLQNVFVSYPHRFTYRAFPGPNSNTFVAWVLTEAQVHCTLDRRAIGSRFPSSYRRRPIC